MYEIISLEKFVEIMDKLTGENVWLKIFTDTIDVDILYEGFEFLCFPNSQQYKFGFEEYEAEREYQDNLININDISTIYRNKYSSMFSGEQIIIVMTDGVNLVIEQNY